jgi:hypothetical protein
MGPQASKSYRKRSLTPLLHGLLVMG